MTRADHDLPAGRRILPEQLPNQLSHGTLAILFAVILLVIGGLVWATKRSDDVSVERQVRVANHSIEVALDELALQQETVAVWDESAQHLVAARPDQVWLHDNVTGWLHRIFSHDVTILVDGYRRPVQVAVERRLVEPSRFNPLKADLAPMIESALGKGAAHRGRHDRLANRTLPKDNSVRTTGRTQHDTHLALVGGRPAAVSAMVVRPSTINFVRPRGDWPVLVSIRYLDGSFLSELEAKHLIDRPRFSRSDEPGAGEHSLPLVTEDGRRLGYLIWEPELPGSRIMGALLPTNAVALALLGMLMLMLTRRLGQTLRERSAFQARAAHLAFHDPLTGLPNRTLLNERLHVALLESKSHEPVVLLLIDLDRFKQVNDTLGHLAGDQLIRDFASRLVGIVRNGDTVARLGGDEFAVVLRQLDPAQVPEMCQSILTLFTAPFELMSNRVFGGASIGAASSRGLSDVTELMRRADVALYRAKADGRNCARLYQPAMDEGAKQRTRLESDLREALDDDALALWSQPIMCAAGREVGQELLLRWNHPALGMVSPEQIIPLAEETGLIIPIGEWVLRQAARISLDSGDRFVALNLSPVQLRDEQFARRMVRIFKEEGADPSRIEAEITEQILMEDSPAIHSSLAALRSAGFRIALDDFGTGYSSLSYLRRFEVDKIKIDRSFVADLHSSSEAQAIVAAIVTLGRALGLTVGVEGVETKRHADVLAAAGCDQLQGYYFGRPAPIKLPQSEETRQSRAA